MVAPGQRHVVRRAARLRRGARHPAARLRPRPLRRAVGVLRRGGGRRRRPGHLARPGRDAGARRAAPAQERPTRHRPRRTDARTRQQGRDRSTAGSARTGGAWCSRRRTPVGCCTSTASCSTCRSTTESDDGGALDFGQGVAYLAIQKAEVYEPPVWPPAPGTAGHAAAPGLRGRRPRRRHRARDRARARRWRSSSRRTTCGCCSTRRVIRSASTTLSQLRLDVGAGARLPVLAGVGGVEQRRLGQQVAQHRGAAGAEQVVGDVGVLAAHVGGVLRVALGTRRQDGQVGVGERAAVRVVVGRAVALGEPDQPGHLVGHGPAGEGVERPTARSVPRRRPGRRTRRRGTTRPASPACRRSPRRLAPARRCGRGPRPGGGCRGSRGRWRTPPAARRGPRSGPSPSGHRDSRPVTSAAAGWSRRSGSRAGSARSGSS